MGSPGGSRGIIKRKLLARGFFQGEGWLLKIGRVYAIGRHSLRPEQADREEKPVVDAEWEPPLSRPNA